MTTTKLPLPIYTFLLKDNSGALFLRSGKIILMPLFTSEDNALLFKQRGKLECNMIQIPNADLLKEFIASPPNKPSKTDIDFEIVIDPIDSLPGELMLLKREQFLDSF